MEIKEYKDIEFGIPVNPFGIPVAQTWNQIGSLFDDFNRFKISLFVELGVYLGGMSELMVIREGLVPNFKYIGIEYDISVIHKRMMHNPHIIIDSVFEDRIVAVVKNAINATSDAALIYCDNGDKPREMRLYAPILRVGDYLRGHDYPGETSPEFLDAFALEFPYMVEIERDKYRELGFSTWKRVA